MNQRRWFPTHSHREAGAAWNFELGKFKIIHSLIQTLKTMIHPVYPQHQNPSQALEDIPEPAKVQVKLLDQDNLPLASGTATLPLLLGLGVFWPHCPMPAASQLATAKCFALQTGEMMRIRTLKLCADNPPRYEFRVSRLIEDDDLVFSE